MTLGDTYTQTHEIYRKIKKVLAQAKADLDDLVKITVYLTDIHTHEDFIRAHSEVFVHSRPAATLAEVSALIHPEMLMEIEAYAIVDQ